MEIEAQGEAFRACADPDSGAFEGWVLPHLVKLRAVAARIVDAADADDVVQETLLRAWQRWETYSPERGAPLPWLVAILLERARRHRIRHLGARSPAGWKTAAFVGSSPANTDQGSADRLDVEAAIATLPQRQQQTVAMFYLADLSVAEVSRVLGIRPGSVKAHLAAARSALRALLEEQ